jgi:hypothetical protein
MGWGLAIAAVVSAGTAAYAANEQKKNAKKAADAQAAGAKTMANVATYNPVTTKDVKGWLKEYNPIYEKQANKALAAGQSQLEGYAPGTTAQLGKDLSFFRDPMKDPAVSNALVRAGYSYALNSGAEADPMDAFARNFGLNAYNMRRQGVTDSQQATSAYQSLIPRGILPSVDTAYAASLADKNGQQVAAQQQAYYGIQGDQARLQGQIAESNGNAQIVGAIGQGVASYFGGMYGRGAGGYSPGTNSAGVYAPYATGWSGGIPKGQVVSQKNGGL